jgi:hypothetical protein
VQNGRELVKVRSQAGREVMVFLRDLAVYEQQGFVRCGTPSSDTATTKPTGNVETIKKVETKKSEG